MEGFHWRYSVTVSLMLVANYQLFWLKLRSCNLSILYLLVLLESYWHFNEVLCKRKSFTSKNDLITSESVVHEMLCQNANDTCRYNVAFTANTLILISFSPFHIFWKIEGSSFQTWKKHSKTFKWRRTLAIRKWRIWNICKSSYSPVTNIFWFFFQ